MTSTYAQLLNGEAPAYKELLSESTKRASPKSTSKVGTAKPEEGCASAGSWFQNVLLSVSPRASPTKSASTVERAWTSPSNSDECSPVCISSSPSGDGEVCVCVLVWVCLLYVHTCVTHTNWLQTHSNNNIQTHTNTVSVSQLHEHTCTHAHTRTHTHTQTHIHTHVGLSCLLIQYHLMMIALVITSIHVFSSPFWTDAKRERTRTYCTYTKQPPGFAWYETPNMIVE